METEAGEGINRKRSRGSAGRDEGVGGGWWCWGVETGE